MNGWKRAQVSRGQPTEGARGPAAVVVGLCAHGLSIVRALARRGVRVHAVEADPSLPGTRTRLASVHHVADINGEGLIGSLRELRSRLRFRAAPVLFLTNDNMVREVARGWSEISDGYRLSWGHRASDILGFVSKTRLQQRCREVGIRYPDTRVLSNPDAVERLSSELGFPLIVKPAQPLSKFKVRIVQDADALRELTRRFPMALPYLLQTYIPGGDRQIRFSALYLDRGRVLARFEGRKLWCLPPGLGNASVLECYPSDAVYRQALRFFEGLELSGPVSLEVKLGPDGTPWVIEPTVGRTDYPTGCYIVNGVNLPYVQYCHQASRPVPRFRQRPGAIWMDTERDPLAIAHGAGALLRAVAAGRKVAFPYAAHDDARPSVVAWRRLARRIGTSLKRRLRQFLDGGKAAL